MGMTTTMSVSRRKTLLENWIRMRHSRVCGGHWRQELSPHLRESETQQ
jgi:hypothetical protein